VLPHLAAELEPSSVELLWIVDVYGFVIAGTLVPMGALGDRIGRRRLLLVGGVLFALASVLTAYAATPEVVIASRALLGLTGATLLPSTLSLVTVVFRDDVQRRLAIAVEHGLQRRQCMAPPTTGPAAGSSCWSRSRCRSTGRTAPPAGST
jgi:DHA2 family multidrug resistance protein-like MFS transporter